MIKRTILILITLLFSIGALASEGLPFLSIKERLRLHLWSYGLEDSRPAKSNLKKSKTLPEEIERPLRKF